jgi:hypothetical protein
MMSCRATRGTAHRVVTPNDDTETGPDRTIPGVHIRRPRVDYESHVVGLDRNEVGAILVAAGLSSVRDHAALMSLMALDGLCVAGMSAPTSRHWDSSVDIAP